MGKRYKLNINHNSEFELDLAPLLAVMVKLVPVLLLSSAFVQMMIIESNLPQVVQKAIEEQVKNEKLPQVAIEMDPAIGVKIIITENGQQKIDVVKLNPDKSFNFPEIHAKFISLKQTYPQIFKVDFSPSGLVPYADVVRLMDEARRPRDIKIRFPITDKATGQETTTEFMFPEVVFANMMDG